MLRAEGISRRFFRKSKMRNFFLAVRETDFSLPPASLTEITGRSGSGKSTLLNMLAGLLQPTTGTVLLDGIDLYQMEDAVRSQLRNRQIGVIPQGHSGLHSLTVLENVMLPCLMYTDSQTTVDEEEIAARALELLDKVGIAPLKDAYPNELSGGETRRLSIARALIRAPEILLADEPTGDLDDENTVSVLRLFREEADRGTAVLLVTHERDAASYADTVYRMSDGALTMESG